MMTRLIIRWLIVGAALYGGMALVARLLAGWALYHPEVASGRKPAAVQHVRDSEGNEVAVLHLPNPAAPFTLWLFHGNAEDLGDIEPGLQTLRDAGFAVFAHDYPGYGSSTGSPSERSLYAASRTARRHLREQLGVPAARTILYGRSLGGGPAVQMAGEEKVAGVVLQSAFASVYRVLTQHRVLPFDLFENERKMSALACPVLVMHGRKDEVIPFAHGEALLAAAPGLKQSFWVAEAGHNDFAEVAGPRYLDTLREFAAACARAQAPATAR